MASFITTVTSLQENGLGLPIVVVLPALVGVSTAIVCLALTIMTIEVVIGTADTRGRMTPPGVVAAVRLPEALLIESDAWEVVAYATATICRRCDTR